MEKLKLEKIYNELLKVQSEYYYSPETIKTIYYRNELEAIAAYVVSKIEKENKNARIEIAKEIKNYKEKNNTISVKGLKSYCQKLINYAEDK